MVIPNASHTKTYQPALSRPYSEAHETRSSAFPKLLDPLTLCCTSRWAGNHEMASKLRSFPRLCPAHWPAGQPIIIPVWKSKTAQQLFPSFPTWEQQKNSTAALLPKNGLSQGSACRGCTAFQPPERSFLCHQCPHLDNLTQMISGPFWTKNIFIPLLIKIHKIEYGTLSVWSAMTSYISENQRSLGRVTLQNRMNFQKNSKWPPTPPPHFRKSYCNFFRKMSENSPL